MSQQKTALIIVLSQAHNDPRIRRQIDWLAGAGWNIDTIGLGGLPSTTVRSHFELSPPGRFVQSKLGLLITYGVMPRLKQFRLLVSDRIPAEALRRIQIGDYDLIVFNDYDFLPLVKDARIFGTGARRSHLHLDLHEYRDERLRRDSLWRLLTGNYYRWIRSLIGDSAFHTRSTVASRIAEFYVEDFGIDMPALVRNSPPYVDQHPTPVEAHNIRLLFHGMASWARGFREIVDAMRLLDDRFTMTFMLTGSSKVKDDLAAYAADLGDRIKIIPPVPMPEITTAINPYDLEIMFYPPNGRNVEFALPNKFFEAIQGRLGLVVGESPMMAELVKEHSNGVVVKGWAAGDLAQAISSLSTERIAELKMASHHAARVLNAEGEGLVFLDTVNQGRQVWRNAKNQ